MEFLKKHLFSIILLVFGLTAFLRGILFLDPDFGWHLKIGELILSKGIPLTDPFSYTMPSYHFIDHEWLSDILLSIGYKTIGIYGLALIFAVIFIAALFLTIPQKFKKYSLLPLVLAGSTLLNFTGIRTQVISWLFLSLLIKIFFDDKLWQKWKFFIPFIFLIWVNLHGGFAVGIALLLLVFLFKTLKSRKLELKDFLIVVLSFTFTLVNPYGINIWHEVWNVLSDNFARFNIPEWMPGIFYTDISWLILLVLSFSFGLRYRKKIGTLKILIYVFLLCLGISSLRHIPLWAISALPVASIAIGFLVNEVEKNKQGEMRLNSVGKILTVVITLILFWEIGLSLVGAYNYSEKIYYPSKAVAYLNKQNLNGNLFSLYDFGGYLIWKLPQKKVFIDGRMPSWRRNDNLANESSYAFRDYLKMIADEKYFKQMLLKYNIKYMLLPKPASTDIHLPPFIKRIREFAQKLILWKTNMNAVSQDLTTIGMKKIYNDGAFVIYEK